MQFLLHVGQVRLIAAVGGAPDGLGGFLEGVVAAGLAHRQLLKVVVLLLRCGYIVVVSGRVQCLGHGLFLAQVLLKHIVLLLGLLITPHAHVGLVIVGVPDAGREH